MIYIVNFSAGLTSWEALRRTIERYGKDQTAVYFADVQGNHPDDHNGEDQDAYRFLHETEQYFGISITRVVEGRDIWQVMFDTRCITLRLANGAQVAPCSKILKREAIDAQITAEYAGIATTRVFGYEWHEVDRMDRLRAALDPIPTWFPLAEPPYVDKCHIARSLEQIGIKPPRLYELGFEHNNCGGFCVKAGQAHFARLWRTMPERYLYHEQREQAFREYVGKDVSILKDRRGGTTKPMTLRAFRERLERGAAYDTLDWGGCGCFAPVAQLRMDDLVAETEVR